MADPLPVAQSPQLFSIAAHRGFADALVAGLAPRYSEPDMGLARLTVLLPSTRARRALSEAFIRHFGAAGQTGLLMPRMVVVGDLDLDEALGPLLDPLGAAGIRPAVDPQLRLFTMAGLLADELGAKAPPSAATRLRLAREAAATMDRLLVEDIDPADLVKDDVVGIYPDLSAHWQDSLRLFARVQARWQAQLDVWGKSDAAARRNRLFDYAAARWSANPPITPIVAAGVTSAAPALARLLRTVSELPRGAVVLPDFDLTMDSTVWEELGRAGAAPKPGETPFARDDAVTHPQYHLKLLLNRMGVAREEVQPWHRKGMAAAPPERSHALGSLFMPPQASRIWADLPANKRRLTGVRLMQAANPEEEAQAIAVLIREAVNTPVKRVALVTPDRGLARRVVHHLDRWNILADDSAGRPLSQTAAGRVLLLLAEVMAEDAAPVPLMALLGHPLADGGMERGVWLRQLRLVERELRGPRTRPGLQPVAETVARLSRRSPSITDWWEVVDAALAPLFAHSGTPQQSLADLIDVLVVAGEALCGDKLWAREDGVALAQFADELRTNARAAGFTLAISDLPSVLRDAMELVAVRPPYGGHGRVAILGLLEARMNRADLVICAGLNEGVWPARGRVDALLAPAVLRVLGVPGADFRIGLSAHDLAGALGAPEVVLSRAIRDEGGPAIPSRFLLRVQALLGEQIDQHRETRAIELARELGRAPQAPVYPRPQPVPNAEQRDVEISATALDRLLGDPFQFYANAILGLRELDGLDADPTPAWQGELAHLILQRWHEARATDPAAAIAPVMADVLNAANVHPLMQGLWVPRLEAALEWVVERIAAEPARSVLAVEAGGDMRVHGVRVHGRADRLDQLESGELGIVDYKTGKPPSAKMVEQGYALQLGILGLIAGAGGFPGYTGNAAAFEYWSLGKSKDADNTHGFGFVETPLKVGNKRSGVLPEDFLPMTRDYLDKAITGWILGDLPFTARLNPDYPGYSTYDQLMRLEEWLPRMDEDERAEGQQ